MTQIGNIYFPEGNKIAEGIMITRTFKAHIYNLKHDLTYLREHLNDDGIKPYAIYWAKQHSMPEFESTLVKYPEYNQHPDLIKATELYNELKKLCEV